MCDFMEYKANGVAIRSTELLELLQNGNILAACKIIQAKSGCTLAAARDLYCEMLKGEHINPNPQAAKIQTFLLAEYECDD